MSTKVKKNLKKYNEFTLTFTGTEGKMCCILNALKNYKKEGSVLAGEIATELSKELEALGFSVR